MSGVFQYYGCLLHISRDGTYSGSDMFELHCHIIEDEMYLLVTIEADLFGAKHCKLFCSTLPDCLRTMSYSLQGYE